MDANRLQEIQSVDARPTDLGIPHPDLVKELAIISYFGQIDLAEPFLKAVMVQAQLKVSLDLLSIGWASTGLCPSLLPNHRTWYACFYFIRRLGTTSEAWLSRDRQSNAAG